jgi:biotin synthase
MAEIRPPFTAGDLLRIHDLPFPDLIFRAQEVHRAHHDPRKVQFCRLLSIKTGGCPEDCAYCPQSAHYQTGVPAEPLLDVERVLQAAADARRSGATRFCMGAAWRSVKGGPEFESILAMVRGVRGLGLEACCTLGMLDQEQADRLKEAGLTAYNHNLDTGSDHYREIITTRSHADRLMTLDRVRRAGITVCSGGIIGMGERVMDRMDLLAALANLDPTPESVPINALVRVAGTPLADRPAVSGIEMTRMVATARIALPRAMVRLSAGRTEMSAETQALCFVAGANSIFLGDKLLTTPNVAEEDDRSLLAALGLEPLTLAR